FSQVPDAEVRSLLDGAARERAPFALRDAEVEVDAGPIRLAGRLAVPPGARAAVVFAHGSGSSRHSPRNRFVAARLGDAGFATLLAHLLTPAEEQDRAHVFDVELLAERLRRATDWTRRELTGLSIGSFGASTGAAAALRAAASPGSPVGAVVSRGGRPDLATAHLPAVRAPTLLIVGSRDEVVLRLNREAATHLLCEHDVEVVPGATHLFEEPGALDTVASLATRWFARHLTTS